MGEKGENMDKYILIGCIGIGIGIAGIIIVILEQAWKYGPLR